MSYILNKTCNVYLNLSQALLEFFEVLIAPLTTLHLHNEGFCVPFGSLKLEGVLAFLF